jgi:hypothetical protein
MRLERKVPAYRLIRGHIRRLFSMLLSVYHLKGVLWGVLRPTYTVTCVLILCTVFPRKIRRSWQQGCHDTRLKEAKPRVLVSKRASYNIRLLNCFDEGLSPIATIITNQLFNSCYGDAKKGLQLQEECIRRRLAKSGAKSDLLARLQAYEAQQAIIKRRNLPL